MDGSNEKPHASAAAVFTTLIALAIFAYIVSSGPMLARFCPYGAIEPDDPFGPVDDGPAVRKAYTPLMYVAPKLTWRYAAWCELFCRTPSARN